MGRGGRGGSEEDGGVFKFENPPPPTATPLLRPGTVDEIVALAAGSCCGTLGGGN